MVSSEVLAELKPYISLAAGLGKVAIALADGCVQGVESWRKVGLLYTFTHKGLYFHALNCGSCPSSCVLGVQKYHPTRHLTGFPGIGFSTISCSGFLDLTITYSSPRGNDLDTRLLRAMVLKGILEVVTEVRLRCVLPPPTV